MFAQRHFTLHVKVHHVKDRRPSRTVVLAEQPTSPARGVDEVSKVVKNGAEDVTNVADFFHSNLTGGLTDEAVMRNRQLYGENVLPAPKLKSIWEFAVDALNDVTLRILILCAFVSVALETSLATDESSYSWLNGAAILLAVAIIVGVECANNYEKQVAFTKLNSRSRDLTTVCVVRNGGTRRLVAKSEIVAGDVILLEAGDVAPADCVVFDGRTLLCDQAHLTGENRRGTKGVRRSDLCSEQNNVRSSKLSSLQRWEKLIGRTNSGTDHQRSTNRDATSGKARRIGD
jgi:magnesium-transporting ATPase (P-type)